MFTRPGRTILPCREMVLVSGGREEGVNAGGMMVVLGFGDDGGCFGGDEVRRT